MTFHGTAPLAALTTIFTPPCPTSWLVTTSKVPSQFPSFPGAGPVPTCNPPSWQDNLSAEGFNFYSPAICPSGFEVGPGCLLTTTPRTTEGFPPVAPDETVAWCVPSGQSCTSDTTDFRGGYWGVTQTATETGALATVGPAMQIRFRDTDLSILETHPLTPGLTLAGLPTPASTSDAATTTSSASQEPLQTLVASTSTAPLSLGIQTARGPATTSSNTFLSNGTAVLSSLPRPTTTSSTSAGLGPGAGGNKDGHDAASKNHTLSSHTRAFAATVAMSCLMGVTAIAIGCYVFLNRRRRYGREKNQETAPDGDAEQGGDTGAAASTARTDTKRAGGWVQRRKEQRPHGHGHGHGHGQGIVDKAKIWWASLPSSKSRTALTGDSDNMLTAWKRRQRARKWEDQLAKQQTTGANAAVPAGAVLPSLPMLELDLGNEKFGHSNNDNGDMEPVIDTYVILPRSKGIPSQPRVDRTSVRQSWMSRLSRYMRGDQGQNMAMSDSSSTPKASPIKNQSNESNYDDETSNGHASTRWSRGTRADTLSIVTDGADYHGHQRGLSDPNCVRADSWAAFARSHQGLGKILAAKKIKGNARSSTSPDSPRSPYSPQPSAANVRIRMQSVAFGNGDASKGLPSPTVTVRSGRTSVQRDSRCLGGDSKRLSRFSDGTFGRMDSFISKASSPTSEMPPVHKEQRRDGGGNDAEAEDKDKGVPSVEAW